MGLHCRLALCFFVLVACVLKHTRGHYHPAHLLALTGGFALYTASLVRRRTPDENNAPPANLSLELALAAVVALFTYQTWLSPTLVFAAQGSSAATLRCCLGAGLALGAGLLFVELTQYRLRDRWWTAAVAVLFALLVAERGLVPQVSPEPQIDVFVVCNQACDYLAAGQNPYSMPYTDIYDGKYDYVSAFGYWPAYLYWSFPFRLFQGDVRYGHVVAEALTGLLLLALSRRLGLSAKASWLAALAWLSLPVGLFVLEQSWIDPVLVLGVVALVFCLHAKRWLTAGLVLGLIAGTKQFGAVVAILTLAHMASQQRSGLARISYAALATLVALFAPFLFWDAAGFYDRTIAVLLHSRLRLDALSLPALAANTIGISIPDMATSVLYLATLAYAAFRLYRMDGWDPGRIVGLLTLFFGVFFLCGKLAFCNYYYFVAALVLLDIIFSVARKSPVPWGEGGDRHS